jgi:hypothetical protein
MVDGTVTGEPFPSHDRTNVRPYPYYGTACTPRSDAKLELNVPVRGPVFEDCQKTIEATREERTYRYSIYYKL